MRNFVIGLECRLPRLSVNRLPGARLRSRDPVGRNTNLSATTLHFDRLRLVRATVILYPLYSSCLTTDLHAYSKMTLRILAYVHVAWKKGSVAVGVGSYYLDKLQGP